MRIRGFDDKSRALTRFLPLLKYRRGRTLDREFLHPSPIHHLGLDPDLLLPQVVTASNDQRPFPAHSSIPFRIRFNRTCSSGRRGRHGLRKVRVELSFDSNLLGLVDSIRSTMVPNTSLRSTTALELGSLGRAKVGDSVATGESVGFFDDVVAESVFTRLSLEVLLQNLGASLVVLEGFLTS